MSNGWKKYKITFIATDSGGVIYLRPNANKDYDFNVLINAPMLEKGTKATDWTRPPKDTTAEIDSVRDYASEIEQTAKGIKSEVTALEKDVSANKTSISD